MCFKLNTSLEFIHIILLKFRLHYNLLVLGMEMTTYCRKQAEFRSIADQLYKHGGLIRT